jgi:hypothetical protein
MKYKKVRYSITTFDSNDAMNHLGDWEGLNAIKMFLKSQGDTLKRCLVYDLNRTPSLRPFPIHGYSYSVEDKKWHKTEVGK